MSTSGYTTTAPPNIPPELQALNQWANWADDKVIQNPHTGKRGSSTNSSTWGTFAQVARRDPDHLVFVFRRAGDLAGVDLDHCRNPETGEIEPWAQDVVGRFPRLYWEISLSGTGLHGIGYGTLPTEKSGWHPDGIGAFHHSRYFVMTGNILPGHETLGDFGDDLADWCRETFPQEPEPSSEPFTRVGLNLATEEIIERASRAANGATFREYYGGGLGNKPSMSEARYALIGACLFWTQDPGQIEEIIRSSGQWTRKIKGRPELLRKEIRDQLQRYRGPVYGDRQQPTSSAPPPEQPPGNSACDIHLAQALQKIAQLERDRDTLIALILNPHVSSAEKTAAAATIDRSIKKPADAEGYVTLKPGEIANDWRPKPDPGENTNPLNRDGSKPRMNRASVKKTMLELTKRGLKVHSKKEDVEPKGRKPYQETVWRVQRPENIADFLAPVAFHQPADMPTRKQRTIVPQCLECGVDLEVTTWTVTEAICPECGDIHRTESKPRTVPPIVTLDDHRGHGDDLSTVRSVTTTGDNLSPKDSTASTSARVTFLHDAICRESPGDQFRTHAGTGVAP